MIFELVNDCIELEVERGIAKTTIKELNTLVSAKYEIKRI